jgi:hypothetical protein
MKDNNKTYTYNFKTFRNLFYIARRTGDYDAVEIAEEFEAVDNLLEGADLTDPDFANIARMHNTAIEGIAEKTQEDIVRVINTKLASIFPFRP